MAAIKGKALVVLGAQWGDEGKGKCVDLLAEQADVVARCQVIHNVHSAPRLDSILLSPIFYGPNSAVLRFLILFSQGLSKQF